MNIETFLCAGKVRSTKWDDVAVVALRRRFICDQPETLTEGCYPRIGFAGAQRCISFQEHRGTPAAGTRVPDVFF